MSGDFFLFWASNTILLLYITSYDIHPPEKLLSVKAVYSTTVYAHFAQCTVQTLSSKESFNYCSKTTLRRHFALAYIIRILKT